MKCPRCPDSVLEERERDGVTVDGCRTCRGIWLDRGELERLIARAASDLDEIDRRGRDRGRDDDRRPAPPAQANGGDHERSWKRDDDRDDRYGRHGDRRDSYRRKRWFEALGDIFD